MTLAVAMIPYVNMAPYRMLGAPNGCRFVPLVPKASISALLSGDVVAAAVPVGGLARLGKVVETVGDFGIAAEGESMSVLLFSKVPFAEFTSRRSLRISGETASSVRLLYLLLGHVHGFDQLPLLSPEGRTPDGELLIGDRALIRGQLPVNDASLFVTDLSRLWFDWHGLPFVFARWVVRRDASDAVKRSIARWLEDFRKEEPDLVEKAVPEAARSLNLDPTVIRRYFQVIRRCLDERDLRGQRRFFDLFEKYGRSPLFHGQKKN